MATIGYPLEKQRPGSTKGAVVFFPRNGKIHASKWPRPRGLPKTQEGLQRIKWMQDVLIAWKSGAEVVYNSANEAAKITKARPQDWFTRNTSGRMWYQAAPEGGMLFPEVFWYCVSTAVDIACAAPAALAVRAADQWRPLTGGLPGEHLTMRDGMPQFGSNGKVDTESNNTQASGWISQSLDAITAIPGSLMLRSSDRWIGIPPGQEGDILKIGADGYPAWQAP
jgi:hypothetical protein